MVVRWLEFVVGPPESVKRIPGLGARFARGHRWPLLLNNQPGIRAHVELDCVANLWRKTPGVAIQVHERICLLLNALLRILVLLPDDDRSEAEQHGEDDADDRVNEPGHVVVLYERVHADSSANEQRAADCERRQRRHEEQSRTTSRRSSWNRDFPTRILARGGRH